MVSSAKGSTLRKATANRLINPCIHQGNCVKHSNTFDDMFFEPNSMLSITKITRAYGIYDYQIETWIKDGWFPQYEWKNGRRYWDSNTFNAFALGSPISSKSLPNQSKASKNIDLLPYLLSGIALIIFNAL